MCATLEKIAHSLSFSLGKSEGEEVAITAVAIAYLLHKAPYVFPVVGGRKVEHLLQNVDALRIALTEEQIREIEAAGPEFDVGFPGRLIVSFKFLLFCRLRLTFKIKGDGMTMTNGLLSMGAFDRVQPVQPIKPVMSSVQAEENRKEEK